MRHLLIGLAAVATAGTASAAIPQYPTPGVQNAANYSFTAAATGDLIAYFAGSTAGFTSVLGVLVNGVDSGITGLNNHATPLGTPLSFGPVTAGDALTFYINVLSTGDTFYSKPSMNVDGVQHIWSTSYAGGDYGIPAGTFVAFEDLRDGGDLNYNDLDFVFTNVGVSNAVPEPATWAMMIAGFGLVGFAMRRRSSAAVA